MPRTILNAMLLALLLVAVPAAGQDQAAGAVPSTIDAADTPQVDQLQALKATLEDPAQRQALLQQIDALIAVKQNTADAPGQPGKPAADSGLLGIATQRVNDFSEKLADFVTSIAALPAAMSAIWQQAQDPEQLVLWGRELAKLGAVIGLALIAGLLAGWLRRRANRVLGRGNDGGWIFTSLAFALNLLFSVAPAAAFLGAGYALLPTFDMLDTTRTLALSLVNAIGIVHGVTAFTRALLAPRETLPRVFMLSDESIAYTRVWVRRFAVVGLYGYFAIQAAAALGLPAGAATVFERLLGLFIAGMGVVLIMQLRQPVRTALRSGAEARSFRARIADTWHLFALVIVVILTVVWLLGTAQGFAQVSRATLLTVLVAGLAAAIAQGVQALVNKLFRLSAEFREIHPRLEQRANRYLPVLRRASKLVVYAIGGVTILQVWGLGAYDWLGSEAGQNVGGRVLAILLTFVVAYVVWEAVTAFLEDALENPKEHLDAATVQRRLTLLPLARNALRLTLIVLVTLVVFSELGINIAPLLAGAGVVGLAVGFGAQSLVRDLITGVFILLEDSVAVGDFVEVAGYSGTVESMNVRSVRLRDLQGNVHTVPFGEVTVVRNYTDKFSYALLDVGVAYRENVDDVMEMLKQVGEEIRQDELWSKDILEPLEMFGLDALADSSVVIRIRLKTQPGRQWAVRREMLRRIKHHFDDNNVEIPFPHRTLYFGEDKGGQAPPARLLVDNTESRGETGGQPGLSEEAPPQGRQPGESNA